MNFDVYMRALGGAVDMLFRPPFSYLVLIFISVASISSIARIVLRFIDFGSVEYHKEDDAEDEDELSKDDETNIDWYISADDFTTWNEEDHKF